MPKYEEIGALWLKTSQGTGKKYLSGPINGEAVVIFKNQYKKEGETTPDYRVYRSQPLDDEQPATHNAERGQATRRAVAENNDPSDPIPF